MGEGMPRFCLLRTQTTVFVYLRVSFLHSLAALSQVHVPGATCEDSAIRQSHIADCHCHGSSPELFSPKF